MTETGHDGAQWARSCRRAASALLVTDDHRYLMQLRDDRPSLRIADHWVLFSGELLPNEDAEAGIRRELLEELEFTAKGLEFFTKSVFDLPFAERHIVEFNVFKARIDDSDVDGMTLHEGAAMKLLTLDELLRLPKLAPWHLAFILMYERCASLFKSPTP